MSMVTMVRLVQERQSQEDSAKKQRDERRLDGGSGSGTEPKQEGSEAKHAVTTALERLTGFIPTEVVAGWGAAVGLIAPKNALTAWMIFAAAVAFLVVILLLETAKRDQQLHVTTDPKRKYQMVLVAAVAFIVWAFATPGSPAAAQWGMEVTRYFAVVAIAVSAILFKLSQLLGLAPIEEP